MTEGIFDLFNLGHRRLLSDGGDLLFTVEGSWIQWWVNVWEVGDWSLGNTPEKKTHSFMFFMISYFRIVIFWDVFQ